MEGRRKRVAPARVWGGILGLVPHIPQKDARKLIWAQLTVVDREMVRCAHNSRRRPQLPLRYYEHLVRVGHWALLEWLRPRAIRPAGAVERAYVLAVGRTDLPALQWITQTETPDKKVVCRMVRVCIMRGHVPILEWMHDSGIYNVEQHVQYVSLLPELIHPSVQVWWDARKT